MQERICRSLEEHSRQREQSAGMPRGGLVLAVGFREQQRGSVHVLCPFSSDLIWSL